MGADLYISTLYEKQRAEWQPQFEAAARWRDSLKAGSKEYRKAQARVEKCYEKMFEQGYFRDPYNDSDLLWKFGLSWWQDVVPMLDKKGRLAVEQAQNLLERLEEREGVFEAKLAQLPAKEQQYFRHRYTSLQNFLNQAIELDAPIEASL